MSDLLRFVEDDLQIIALCFMGAVYILRIRWILSFKAGRERQPANCQAGVSPSEAIIYSLTNVLRPMGMESTRLRLPFYAQFVIFHLGAAAGIGMSFLIPYVPGLMKYSFIVLGFQVVMGLAAAVGIYRLYRRLSDPVMRLISTPDDIFSLLLLTVWMISAVWAAPNRPQEGEAPLMIYFLLTTFFLIYVPFSKISHYLYYPFARFYFGKTMGHRGVFPLKPCPPADSEGRGQNLTNAGVSDAG